MVSIVMLRSTLKSIIAGVMVVPSLTASAQTVEIDWVQISGRDIVIHYNLDDENPLHAYTVNVFSSIDEFAKPLLKLSGHYGNEVKPGTDKQIRWHITEELGNYAGEIEFELRAKMYVPFMKMTDFNAMTKYKRSKNYPLTWKTGNPGGQVDIELYLQDKRIHSDRNVANTGKFDWQVPGNVKPSSSYKLKFTNVKSREETYLTPSFRIVNKFPLVAKVAAGAVVGFGIFILAQGGAAKPDPILPAVDEVGLPGGN